MTVSLIVAVAENGVIGHEADGLPWRQSADLKRFRATTMGSSIIMGRKTYEEMPTKPLDGRQNIVVTHNADYSAPGCLVVTSLDEALNKAESEEVFVIGGGEIFKQALPRADKLYLSIVHASPEGNTTFTYNEGEWSEISSESFNKDKDNQYDYTFKVLTRISSVA